MQGVPVAAHALRVCRVSSIERAVREYLGRLATQERDERDLDLINRRVEGLNGEAMDVLDYQVDL